MAQEDRAAAFPLGAALTLTELEADPHPALAALRAREPVSWVPVLDGWLVSRRDLVIEVMRDAATYTVDDPRFSTAQVVGPSMLSLDGPRHYLHRQPFSAAFRQSAIHERFGEWVDAEARRRVRALKTGGAAELRRDLAGPFAVAVVTRALGLRDVDPATILGWYDAIVAAVSDITARRPADPSGGRAFDELRQSVEATLAASTDSLLKVAAAGGLDSAEVVSNAAVLMFGGIETSEGMTANALLHLLAHTDQLAVVDGERTLLDPAIDESLRLEPAAAVLDRYATRDVSLAGASIRSGDVVRVSLAGANRDPAAFPDPDRFDVRRPNARQHVAFAHGPHVCLGVHLARLETRAAIAAVLDLLPGIRLDTARRVPPHGLVFRKPASLHVRWD